MGVFMGDGLLTQGHLSSLCELERLRGLTPFCLLWLAPVPAENCSFLNEGEGGKEKNKK